MANQSRKNHVAILDRVKSMIDSSGKNQKDVLDRYISLANKKLHNIIDDNPSLSVDIIGASQGLQQRYKSKFGTFIPRPNH